MMRQKVQGRMTQTWDNRGILVAGAQGGCLNRSTDVCPRQQLTERVQDVSLGVVGWPNWTLWLPGPSFPLPLGDR